MFVIVDVFLMVLLVPNTYWRRLCRFRLRRLWRWLWRRLWRCWLRRLCRCLRWRWLLRRRPPICVGLAPDDAISGICSTYTCDYYSTLVLVSANNRWRAACWSQAGRTMCVQKVWNAGVLIGRSIAAAIWVCWAIGSVRRGVNASFSNRVSIRRSVPSRLIGMWLEAIMANRDVRKVGDRSGGWAFRRSCRDSVVQLSGCSVAIAKSI